MCLRPINSHDREHIDEEKNKIQKDISNCEQDIESLRQQREGILSLKNTDNRVLSDTSLLTFLPFTSKFTFFTSALL